MPLFPDKPEPPETKDQRPLFIVWMGKESFGCKPMLLSAFGNSKGS